MDFLSAAYQILHQAGQALHFREITQRALAKGLISPSGLTPEATMGSRLYVDTKKEDSRFERAGRGRFALKRKSLPDEFAKRVEEINDLTRQTLRKRLHEIPADRFETLIGELLIAVGFEESTVHITPYSNDGGIDVRGILNVANMTAVNAAVQAKRWKGNVQANVVRELRGSLTTHEQGVIITTSNFSSGARDEANAIGKAPISLINGAELIEMLIEHSIGVSKVPHTVFALDDEWWNNINNVSPDEVDSQDFVQNPIPSVNLDSILHFPLTVRAINSPEQIGRLLSIHGQMEFQGKAYSSPSTAGKVASGWKSCNGWRYWQFQHPESKEWRPIGELRGASDSRADN
jgi:restriction system protein